MKAEELINLFNRTFGLRRDWPKTFEVDADTYANCCQIIFNDYVIRTLEQDPNSVNKSRVCLTLGNNNGIMFKNVELIFK